MLWNDKFLFLHVPKTAGTSLTSALCSAWHRPISGIVAQASYREEMERDPAGLALTIGGAHSSLPRAKAILAGRNISLDDFAAIVVAIRDPYAIMVSTYHFMRNAYRMEPDNPKHRFAAERDFATFCARVPMTDVRQWLSLDGRRPDNLVILRFEHLAQDFAAVADRHGFRPTQLPQRNASTHAAVDTYMTPAIRASIQRKLPYLFDEGFYPR